MTTKRVSRSKRGAYWTRGLIAHAKSSPYSETLVYIDRGVHMVCEKKTRTGLIRTCSGGVTSFASQTQSETNLPINRFIWLLVWTGV